MRKVYERLASLATGPTPVLITGETGVGKEHAVKILHASSDRTQGPLQIVNCAAIPAELLEAELFGIEARVASGVDRRPGKMQLADGGMLFLEFGFDQCEAVFQCLKKSGYLNIQIKQDIAGHDRIAIAENPQC